MEVTFKQRFETKVLSEELAKILRLDVEDTCMILRQFAAGSAQHISMMN